MKTNGILELIAVIDKQSAASRTIYAALIAAIERDIPALGRSGNAAVMLAGLLENYYTCLETAYLRISQAFENNLDKDRWHMALLEKMRLRIEGVRLPAVSDANYANLLELLKFRHFRRYYFELESDWDRLDFLVAKTKTAHPIALVDLGNFIAFLKKI